MSGHGDPHDDAGDDTHDDHEHDDHHAPPPPEEPVTPLWLTLLGVGLFLIAGIVFIATRADGKTTAELTAASAEQAPNAAPANPAPRGNAPANAGANAQPAARP